MGKTEIGITAHRWPDDDAMEFLEKKAREWAREPPAERRCECCGGSSLTRILRVSIESQMPGCGEAVVQCEAFFRCEDCGIRSDSMASLGIIQG